MATNIERSSACPVEVLVLVGDVTVVGSGVVGECGGHDGLSFRLAVEDRPRAVRGGEVEAPQHLRVECDDDCGQ